jgi:hypothetical protein
MNRPYHHDGRVLNPDLNRIEQAHCGLTSKSGDRSLGWNLLPSFWVSDQEFDIIPIKLGSFLLAPFPGQLNLIGSLLLCRGMMYKTIDPFADKTRRSVGIFSRIAPLSRPRAG